MPDKRKHRGPHPADAELFAPRHHAALREAVSDFSWLLTHRYSPRAALKLVGDRFQLTGRQRLAVMRCGCSDPSRRRRRELQLTPDALPGREIVIDGFNLLTTIEASLSGGAILIGRDGCFRDMAGMHGSYRKVEETRPALKLIGEILNELQTGPCVWLFDRPVSNSGRIGALTDELAAQYAWNWRFELSNNPDRLLMETEHVIVTADSAVIDGCTRWFNLAEYTIRNAVPEAWIVDLREIEPGDD